jgi:hypothetical protein
MTDPLGFRTSMLLAADLTLQAARAFTAFWDAALAPFDPMGDRPAAPRRQEEAPVAEAPIAPPPPVEPEIEVFPPAESSVTPPRPKAPHRRFADLVVYRVEIAVPGPGIAVEDTFLGRSAVLDDIGALGATALHVTPRRPGPAWFTAGTLDRYAVGDDAINALLPALNAARAAHGAAPLAAIDLRSARQQVQCLVDVCHLAGLAVLIDLAEESAADFAESAGFDGLRLADPKARSNEPGTGRLIWHGREVGLPAGDTLRIVMRDLLRAARDRDGGLSFAALEAGFATPSDATFVGLSDPDDFESPAVLADPQTPRGWVARSRLRLLTSLQFAAPGAPVLPAGAERFAGGEFDGNRDGAGADALRFTRDAIALRNAEPGLRGDGLRVTRADPDARVFILHRWVADGSAGRDVIVVANFSGDTHHGYRVGLPRGGWWREIFNSDAFESDFDRPVIGNGGAVDAHDGPLDGFAHSVPMTLPPNAALFFTPCG